MSNEPCIFVVKWEEPGILTHESSSLQQGFHTWLDALKKCRELSRTEVHCLSGYVEEHIADLVHSNGKLVKAELR